MNSSRLKTDYQVSTTKMFRAKKSLGQNFLSSTAIIADIIRAGGVGAGDTVLEVGPGKGVLTEGLLSAGAKVIAVEKDDRLMELLETKFAEEIKNKKLTLVHADILEIDPPIKGEYKLLANIPYYITGQLFRKFLEEAKIQPSRMVLMLQKEVAQRIVAREGKESILSLSVKAYGTPKYIKTVPAKYFSPAPKVDSAILAVENISRKLFSLVPEKKFFELIKQGFAQKRKMLRSNLKCPQVIFDQCGLDEKIRAEDLKLGDWVSLWTKLSQQS